MKLVLDPTSHISGETNISFFFFVVFFAMEIRVY